MKELISDLTNYFYSKASNGSSLDIIGNIERGTENGKLHLQNIHNIIRDITIHDKEIGKLLSTMMIVLEESFSKIQRTHGIAKHLPKAAKVRQNNADEFAKSMLPHILEAEAKGIVTTPKMATYFNEQGITTRRGDSYVSGSVVRLWQRLEAMGLYVPVKKRKASQELDSAPGVE